MVTPASTMRNHRRSYRGGTTHSAIQPTANTATATHCAVWNAASSVEKHGWSNPSPQLASTSASTEMPNPQQSEARPAKRVSIAAVGRFNSRPGAGPTAS